MRPAMPTCRDQVLAAFERLERRHGRREFRPIEVIQEVLTVTDRYPESTIRTHVVSRMCADAPDHHGGTCDDLERVDRGVYRRRVASGAPDADRALMPHPPPPPPPLQSALPPPSPLLPPQPVTARVAPDARRIALVGCVKEKAFSPRPARDLYTSTLFAGRRAYAERTCSEWWVLSAAHGLVHPDQVLAPYDVALKRESRATRRRWSEHVLDSIRTAIDPHHGDVFEIHSGAEYRDFGLVDGLRAMGCTVEVPTLHLPIGRQLQFYKVASHR